MKSGVTEPDVVFISPEMQALFEEAARIAQFPSTVLIEGETGAGKEVVANWIHRHSPRSNMPFTKVNCASIPESLFESELFGYERGAFTGAKREGNPGLFELSDKGTLLLDEVGELSPSFQAKLLRVLQDREIRRVGGSWSRVIDVRIIACTNRDLRQMVEAGQFRADLFYRLHVATLFVPPLRQHKEDIPPLLRHFLAQICREFGIERRFSPEAFDALVHYDYPGNVRELRNLVEGLCVRAKDEVIDVADLPPYIVARAQTRPITLQQHLDAAERAAIAEALEEEGSVRRAAMRLGISHSTLLRKMARLGMTSAR